MRGLPDQAPAPTLLGQTVPLFTALFFLAVACDPRPATTRDSPAPTIGDTDDDGHETAEPRDSADGGGDTSDDEDSGDDGPTLTADPMTILGHAQECAIALGRIPGFSCDEDGVEVPITVDGTVPSDDAYRAGMNCDRPAMLTGNCLPWSRVGWKQGTTWSGEPDPDVDWVFTCRRHSLDHGRDGGTYGDVAMIGHRKSTGETCFFQSFPNTRVQRAPSPLERPADTPTDHPTAGDFWLAPPETADISCGPSCHDNDPWIHSPWVDQVQRRDDSGQLLVPSGQDRERPYVVVGAAFEDWDMPFEQINPAGNGCVSCHRIGTGGTCSNFAIYAAGASDSMPLSDSAHHFPLSHWMPPDGPASEADWDARWLDDVEQIVTCCYDDDDASCNREPIPTE